MQGRMGPPQDSGAGVAGQSAVQDDQGRRLEFLGRVGLFYGVDPRLLAQVATVLRPVPVAAGTIVCREGDPADMFFLIDEGSFTILIDPTGTPRELATIGPGEFFGEAALRSDGVRATTVRADTRALIWALTAHDFQALLAHSPELAATVRRAAQIRTAVRTAAVFEVERRNLAALAHGKQRITIGRGAENDLVFQSRLVSRNHAVVEWSGDQYSIRDLGSSNGTFINGTPTRGATLSDGDEIWVADERFIFDRREIRRVVEPRGIGIDLTDIVKEVKGGKRLLQAITLSILPGEFVAIVGGSGAGKTTLMDAMSGVRPATSGRVLYNGHDYYRNIDRFRNVLGYVPQDDIIHTTLPVRRTLDYAARLRLPADTTKADRDAAVEQALTSLNLTGQANILVGSLSGGQRKRSSIGVELLTQPRIFFLDEPTSGLDPATDLQMMRLMRKLSDEGSTVVLTTHATKNVMLCDKIVFLARGGHLAFFGSPQRALQYFNAEAFDEIYERLADELTPEQWGERFRASEDFVRIAHAQPSADGAGGAAVPLVDSYRGGGILQQFRQLAVLNRRGLDIFFKHPPSLIPLLIQPLIIAILLLVLFPSGAFELTTSDPRTGALILFFLAFGAFQFGLFDGIQEIVKEMAIFRRERMVNLGIFPYVFSKLTLLTPVVLFSLLVMMLILLVTGRLPDGGVSVYVPFVWTLILSSISALALGLFVSAAVASPEQANQLMPGLIMPQVLFSGGVIAVPSMNVVGRLISGLMSSRWSFEALGQIVNVNNILENGTSPIGKGLKQQYGETFSRDPIQNWIILFAFFVVFIVLTCVILKRKSAA